MHVPAFMDAQRSKAVIGSSLLWLLGSVSDLLSPLYGNRPQWCRNPTAPSSRPPAFRACLQTIGAAEALHQRQQVGRRGSTRRGSFPVPAPCGVLPCGSCHVTETPTLSRLCQQWPCALSLHVLLMEAARSPGGWQGVGEHLCNTADCTLL